MIQLPWYWRHCRVEHCTTLELNFFIDMAFIPLTVDIFLQLWQLWVQIGWVGRGRKIISILLSIIYKYGRKNMFEPIKQCPWDIFYLSRTLRISGAWRGWGRSGSQSTRPGSTRSARSNRNHYSPLWKLMAKTKKIINIEFLQYRFLSSSFKGYFIFCSRELYILKGGLASQFVYYHSFSQWMEIFFL